MARLSVLQRQQEDASQGDSREGDVRQLWGRSFTQVNEGLSEAQVVEFVNDLLASHRAKVQGLARAQSMRRLDPNGTVGEADRKAAILLIQARKEARAEGARLIAEAQRQSQEIVSETRKQAQASAEQKSKPTFPRSAAWVRRNPVRVLPI